MYEPVRRWEWETRPLASIASKIVLRSCADMRCPPKRPYPDTGSAMLSILHRCQPVWLLNWTEASSNFSENSRACDTPVLSRSTSYWSSCSGKAALRLPTKPCTTWLWTLSTRLLMTCSWQGTKRRLRWFCSAQRITSTLARYSTRP
jgi:hypothetical protein